MAEKKKVDKVKVAFFVVLALSIFVYSAMGTILVLAWT
jgi:hypothetical protein